MRKIKLGKTFEDANLNKQILYPEDWESNFINSKTRVSKSGYIISINYLPNNTNPKQKFIDFIKKNKHFIYSKIGFEYLLKDEKLDINIIIKPKNSHNNKNLKPFKENYLYEKIAKIDWQNYDSVINFCNKYGVLSEYKKTLSQNFLDFAGEVVNMKVCMNLWLGIINEDKEGLKSHEKFINSYLKINSVGININNKLTNNKLEWNDKDIFYKAKNVLMLKVNKKLSQINPSIQLSKNMELVPGLNTQQIISVAYYQFYKTIINEVELKKCPYCKSLFTPRNPKQKYCPTPEGYTRSPCENKYNQDKYKARKKIKSGKSTIKEVANEMKYPIDVVKGWF